MNVFVLAEQTKTVQTMSTSSCAPAHPFYSPVRLFKTRAVTILRNELRGNAQSLCCITSGSCH